MQNNNNIAEEQEQTNQNNAHVEPEYTLAETPHLKSIHPNQQSIDSIRIAASTMNIDITAQEANRRKQENYDINTSIRAEDPLNEFENNDYALSMAFPDIFLFGKAYGKRSGLSPTQIKHLLYQYTTAAATNRTLIFYLFDQQKRHKNTQGVKAKIYQNRQAFKTFSELATSASFEKLLKTAAEKPDSKEAKQVISKVKNVLYCSGKHTL